MHKPGDNPELALAAIRKVDGGPVDTRAELTLLHRSNNVVARVGNAVAKVMNVDDPGCLREFNLAVHGFRVGAPVLTPVAEPSVVGDYIITWWPFVDAVGGEAEPAALSAALRAFHSRMRSTTVTLPSPAEAATSTLNLALDEQATGAMSDTARRVIVPVVESVAKLPSLEGGPVVHGEPHSGNSLVTDGGVVLIDLEGVKRAPVEYDLAFLTPEAVDTHWPGHARTFWPTCAES